ncbi:NADPH-dependent FMN reductase [Cellulomonas bogoriensis]|uniref:NADPH-dependent FMN reductase n=1 Tax=Cellulomonas bogoriensis 69B4 = DSM 16987 TaxID=1386082 RepID=A0A0A0BW27_9CELL|nr:NADPH-dependent FMN reductase [Cellulomonas bogoriensis]KGM12598.1 NADPH-dependent FMN reductase [Cellulomonas bogoriensis 69B4 = DSM 16987]
MDVLQVVVTSTRPTRIGGVVGSWFTRLAQGHGGFEVRTTDLAELELPLLDEEAEPNERRYTKPHTLAWSETIEAADAVVFVLPEYNFSFPASAKNAVDCLYDEWHYKPVGLVSYGNTSGGLRSAQAFKPVLSTMKMFPLPGQVALQFAGQLIKDAELHASENHEAAAKGMLDELAFLSPHFRAIREARAS